MQRDRDNDESPLTRTMTESWRSPSDAPSPPAGDSAGGFRRLGQYELLEQLGKGGMGTVYKARHVKLKRDVAVKVLSHERMSDPSSIARFLREMEAVGRLDHANIVRAHDAGDADGTHYLVMEYCTGLDVSKVARRAGTMSVPDACEIVRQAALGLAHAHEHGLVHRDIKPSNLMLTSTGVVKILDLGLARLSVEAVGDCLTTSGRLIGTVDYMAPEQAFVHNAVDIRSDLYSLGCTLYKLLSGQAPFSDSRYDTVLKKMMAHAQEPPPAIEQLCPGLPAPVIEIVNRLLAKKPDDRYADPSAAVEALTPHAAGAHLAALVKRAETGAAADDNSDESIPGSSTYPAPERTTDRATPASRVRETHQLGRAAETHQVLAEISTQAQPSIERRRALRTVVKWSIGLGGAGAFCTGGWMAFRGKDGGDRLEYVPGKWHHPLRDGEPSELAREDSRLAATMSHERDLEELRLDSANYIAASLGHPAADTYRLRVRLKQHVWSGEAGIFFGWHTVISDTGEIEQRCQAVLLHSVSPRKGAIFNVCRLIFTVSQLNEKQFDFKAGRQGCQQVRIREGADQEIEIFVEENSLSAVQWNGRALGSLVSPAIDKRLSEFNVSGQIGLINQGNLTAFNDIGFFIAH